MREFSIMEFMKVKISTLLFALALLCDAGELGLVADWADFRGDKPGYSWLEIYTKLDRQNFKFIPVPDSNFYAGTLAVNIRIEDASGATADSLEYSAPIKIPADQIISKPFRILNVYPFHLPVGKYLVQITVRDKLSDKTDSSRFTVELEDYFSGTPKFSKVMLAYSATPTKENTTLDRMGFRMFPNPSHRFARGDLTLYHYSEFYLPDTNTRKVGICQKIFSGDTLFRSFEPEWFKVSGASWYIGGFSVAGFPEGTYRLRLCLITQNGETLATRDVGFAVKKRASVEEQNLSEEDIRNLRYMLSFVATPEQLKTFDNLDKNGKILFWERFWSERDPDPETPENEALDEYIERWNYVNERFREGDTPGWRTDRGRIYLTYGPPDDVERHTFGASENTWEQWNYFDKNLYFVFADTKGLGKMELVDSNAEGEIHDPNWRLKLSSPGGYQLYQQNR